MLISRSPSKTPDVMRSKLINNILAQAGKIANTPQNVVIIGEYGSGKSWLAKRIHDISNRKDKPYISINCNTMPEDDVCERIFGYLAFTGHGVKINKGLFEQGRGGTLFLEGFDSFSESLQLQIIESAESKKVFPVGSQRPVPVDVRVIGSVDVKVFYHAQAKYNLMKTILNDVPYIVFHPPLRRRRDEITYLIDSFLKEELSTKYNFVSGNISQHALYMCIRYDWPGNVKQLKNAIEHAAVLSAGNNIQPEHLPASVKTGQPDERHMERLKNDVSFRTAEKQLLLDVLNKTHSEQDTARLLGLDLAALKEKKQRYSLVGEYSN